MAVTRRYLAGSALLGYGALQVLGRSAGATRPERRAPLAGDELVRHPQIITNHAISVEATAEAVWPWLSQMGWHLGGYYTPEWVDRLLFPKNWPSLNNLDPTLTRDLQVGDVISDGPQGTAWFVVTEVDAPHVLVLRSTTHVPPEWRDKYGASIDWTWSYHLTGQPAGRTRLHLRVRARTEPWWLTATYVAALMPADFVMARGMLRGIKRRVESNAPLKPSERSPLAASVR